MDITIKKVRVPAKSLAMHAFSKVDYADAYAVPLPPGNEVDIDTLARAFFSAAPNWVDALMSLRDVLAGSIGLKMAASATRPSKQEMKRKLEPGMRAGVFKVYERTEREILMGEDDRHLDFRVSVLLHRQAGVRWLVVSTVVRFNGWLGRAYFLPVRPFHKLIVPAMVKGMVKAAETLSTA